MNWKQLNVKQIEDFCNKTYGRYAEYPSIRDIFYAFVGDLFPNTKGSYHGIVKWLVEKRLSGEIDWHIIRDGSGREIHAGDIEYESPEDYFGAWLDSFKTCAERYKMPKWADQKNKVIVLCEKEADYPIVKSILSDLNVDVGYMRGYSGKRIMFEMAEELKRCGKTPKILVLGDFDPSGADIKKNVSRDMSKMGLVVEPINLSVTIEQINKFKLPHIPEDPEEIEKLQKDPRYKNWKYGLFRVETASLRVRQPEYFDNLLRLEVRKCFDETANATVRKKERKAKKEIEAKVADIIG